MGGLDNENAPGSENKAANDVLNIKIKDQMGIVDFKVKKDTPFEKIFNAYNKHRGVSSGAYTFMFDGARLGAMHTPKMLEMEEDDQIDAVVEQLGGC